MYPFGLPLWFFVPLAAVASFAATGAIIAIAIALNHSERSRKRVMIALEVICALLEFLP